MTPDIKTITDNKIWTNFFNTAGSPTFLHSWEWGEFQKRQNCPIERLGIYDNNQLAAIALALKIKSKRGNFLFIPHGPIFKQLNINNQQLISQFLNFLISLANKEGCSFIRIAPILENTEENQQIFKNLGFRQAPIYMHAETVWVLPIFDDSNHRIFTDEELLSKMRKTTRYLINKAGRGGGVIEKRQDDKAIDDFYSIYEQTVKRENFTPFSKQFIKNEFEAFNKTGKAVFLFARLQTPEVKEERSDGKTSGVNEYLASALIIFTPSTAFYHQGASIHTKYPASYLLQWEAIKEARKRGCQYYNFWGIHQPGRTPKSWAGLTLFKQGFDGQAINYLPTQDFIISPKYYLTFFYEKFLNWRRKV